MLQKVLLVLACALLTGATWFLLDKTHPVFVAEEAIAAGRDAGGLTEEWINDIRGDELRSAMLTYAVWGAVLAGFCGFGCHPRPRSRVVGLVVGILLGSVAGALGGYLGQYHDLSVEYTGPAAGYWLLRWVALAGPIALAAGVACATSGHFIKDITDCIAASLIGAAVGIASVSLLIGIITPMESHQYIYPGFSSSRLVALMSINLGVVISLVSFLARSPKARSGDAALVSANGSEAQ